MSAGPHLIRARDALAARASAPDAADPTGAGWNLEVIDHRPNHVRGGRSVLRARARQDNATCIVKVYDHPDTARLRFTRLKALRQHTDAVVTPLFLDADRNLYAMQDAGRLTLADRLGRGSGAGVTADVLRWLIGFCAEAPATTAAFDPTPLLDTAARDIAQLPKASQATGHRALTELRAAFAPFDGQPLRHVTVFGDLKPENLCLHSPGGTVTGVDFVHDRPHPIERDTAFLLQWMRRHNWRKALARTGWIDPDDEPENRAAAEAVLGDRIDARLLAAYERAFLLRLWVGLVTSGNAPALRETAEARLLF